VEQVRNSPIVTQNVVTYNVVVRVDNRDLSLKPGMTANVMLQVRKIGDILKIPNVALRYRPSETGKEPGPGKDREKGRLAGGQRVYVLGKDGKPVAVAVKTGVSDGTHTQLAEGDLKEGDALVAGETQRKRNGAGGSPPGMGFGRFR
jgi:HlyD family secretion protein